MMFVCVCLCAAVQDERQKAKDADDEDMESSVNDMPVDKLLEAEFTVDPEVDTYVETQVRPVTQLVNALC